MKIALLDLNHSTMGIHTNTVPLGISVISRYLENNVLADLDIKIFKDHNKFSRILKKWTPDALGIAQYSWNSYLNLYFAQLAKKRNPGCLVVAGGPNLYLTKAEKIEFLKTHRVIDVCVEYDGEIPFAEIVRRMACGEKIKELQSTPVAGTYLLSNNGERLLESIGQAPRLKTLDIFGPMYADGFFDELLQQGFHPFLQTQRGCPFKCAYCHTGDLYHSRVIFQGPEVFRQDLEYLGRRFKGQHNVILYMANTNFGLFDEDFEIARIIRNVQDRYDWPVNININSAHNPDRVIKILSLLKYKFMPVVSLQTLTPKVLRNIKRNNMPLTDFVNFQKSMIKNVGKITATELILSLPGETKKSFLKTITSVLNSGVQNIVIFTLMALRGTPLALPQMAKRYGHIIRHRIVPRCFSRINNINIFETEEVVVGTKAMPFNDYRRLRGLALVIGVFASSAEMFPIRKYLMEKNLEVASWIFGIEKKIPDYPGLNSAYRAFLRESKDELFPSRDALVKFFNKPKNYDLLCAGAFGDNLLRKYKTLFISRHYLQCLEAAILGLCRMLGRQNNSKSPNLLISDFNTYLKSRDISYIFRDGYSNKEPGNIGLHYDIPGWLADENSRECLEKRKGLFRYSIQVTDYMRKRLGDFMRTNRDPELSLQILYRDGYINDFWPQWVEIGGVKQ